MISPKPYQKYKCSELISLLIEVYVGEVLGCDIMTDL